MCLDGLVSQYPNIQKDPLFYPINFEDIGRGLVSTLFWGGWPGIGSNEDICKNTIYNSLIIRAP
jgi:hypothetical protein